MPKLQKINTDTRKGYQITIPIDAIRRLEWENVEYVFVDIDQNQKRLIITEE